MCGRITLAVEPGEIAEYFQLSEVPLLEPRYNIAPTQNVAVLRNAPGKGVRELALLRWGLIPSWAEDLNVGSRMINARSETIAHKPAFREAFKKRRCLVAADGFYEWKREGGGKQPYIIRVKDQKCFALAGLWDRKDTPEGPLETFTILTTSANELVAPLHDRMPVILDTAGCEQWLDESVQDQEKLKSLLRPYPAERMCMEPVDDFVNNPANEGERCIAPPAARPAAEESKPARRRRGEDPNQGMLF
ncbi:MAG TPA: SOS response-associated peptidase [Planctomycetota bacterium]|nr:SOS response-associated peptidase [Planctomycetota bacterium]